jgi:SAM-dependent methyltransferase
MQNLTWEEAVLLYRSNSENAESIIACYYDDPLLGAAERYRGSQEFHELASYLPAKKGLLLDVGAGRGISSYALAKEGWDVVALEPNPSNSVGSGAIRQLACESLTNITTVENWGERLPFDDACFDVVHGRAVLHHARDLGAFCMEAARVLKPGGRFIAIREHVITHELDLPRFLEKHPLHSLYGGEHAFTLSAYRSAIESAGLVMTSELNPWASLINLHPDDYKSLRNKISKAVRMPIGSILSQKVLKILGGLYQSPGRLYSFISDKPEF